MLPEYLRRWPICRQILQMHDANPAAFWRAPLFACFWLSLALFPIGYGFREVMPPLCLLFLLPYYRHNWRESSLFRLGALRWLFACAAGMIILGVVFSIHPFSSLMHAGMGINKAYILPFIAMECARDSRDLRRLCWACVLACFWQGLDGVWQAFTGADFIMGYVHRGRLTGSLGDYTVGNYLALAMIPAFGVWSLLCPRLGVPAAILVFAALFWPPVFLFIGASSRSGVLAIAAALFIWALLRRGLRHWLWLVLPAAAVGLFLLFEGSRFSPGAVLDDNRWDLWRLAWRVFLEHPWLGAGAGQYNAAFQALSLAPVREVITISHPHNIYLDMLYAHGLVGFSLGSVFLFGFAWWLLARARQHLGKGADEHWLLTAWFALGYVGWLFNGIFGHDFYRIWWLALAMCNLGIAIGGVVNAPGEAPPKK